MKTQLHLFLTAVMFYTRIPCPKWVDHSDDYLNRATVYFPIIGWLVGGVSALVYIVLFSMLGRFTSESHHIHYSFLPVVGSMLASILLTGAFHEDGFADVCDGFGGGWTKIRILEIMKDSRVGTYGVIGLLGILVLKVLLIQEIMLGILNQPIVVFYRFCFFSINWMLFTHMAFIFLIAHSLSRFTAMTFIFSHTYVRENEDSKAKPVAKKLSKNKLLLAFLPAVLPLVAYMYVLHSWLPALVFAPLLLAKWYLGRYFQRWIGGYTGDCLGATQQVAEVVIYLYLAVVWRYI